MSVIKRVIGKDFNFFSKVAISNSGFPVGSDVQWAFQARFLTLQNEGTTTSQIIEYSFNGNTVHGELQPTKASAALSFEDRPGSAIWFRVKTGSAGPVTIRVEAYGCK